MSQALKARASILVLCMAAVSAPALAHQSLTAHSHPHNESWLFGLDFNLIITLAAAGLIVLAVASRRRKVLDKMRNGETDSNSRGWL